MTPIMFFTTSPADSMFYWVLGSLLGSTVPFYCAVSGGSILVHTDTGVGGKSLSSDNASSQWLLRPLISAAQEQTRFHEPREVELRHGHLLTAYEVIGPTGWCLLKLFLASYIYNLPQILHYVTFSICFIEASRFWAYAASEHLFSDAHGSELPYGAIDGTPLKLPWYTSLSTRMKVL